MSGYLVLARKYRSTTFDEVVGQEPISQTLKNGLSGGRIAQAYLFTGTRGVGKTTVARILAKALNCLASDKPTPEPCNKCDACVAIARGDDVDVIEIDGASNRGIDEIRQLRANATLRPARSRYKVYYIDEVHMLTKEAFNALLKTLEEPPEHVKFIFATTEFEKVPATIVSRCQRFDFRNIPVRRIAEHLAQICKQEEIKAQPDALFRIARFAAGSMRDGLSLLDQIISAGGEVGDAEVIRILGTPSDERTIAIAGAIAANDAPLALKELNDILESGVTISSAVAALGEAFRNMMLAAACGRDSDLIELPETQRQQIAGLAGRCTLPALVSAVGIIHATTRNLRLSSVGRALVEAMLVRLAAADKFVDPASLIERLEALARGGVAAAQKKNPSPLADSASAPRQSAASVNGPPQAGAPNAAAEPLQWEAAWLKSNWQRVIERLAAQRQMQVAGLLRAAKVEGFDGGVLKLSFDQAHEVLRQRCAGPMAVPITAAVAALAGRQVQCEFVSNGAPAANGEPRRTFNALSTDEKTNIAKDPAVRAVMDLFGGELVDIRKDASATAGEDEGEH